MLKLYDTWLFVDGSGISTAVAFLYTLPCWLWWCIRYSLRTNSLKKFLFFWDTLESQHQSQVYSETMFLNTWVRVIVLDDCIYILRNNVLKCKCLQFPLTSWKHDHSAWILLKVAQQRHAKQSWCWQVLTKIFCTCNTKFQECARTKTLYSRASDRKCCQNLCFRYREW